MESDPRDWASHSQEGCFGSEEEEVPDPVTVEDPLAELGCDLALCYMALEEGRGGFCDYCTCQLTYHVTTENGECEICGCYEQAKKPEPVWIAPSPAVRPARVDRLGGFNYPQVRERADRAREARKALAELTE